MASPTRIIIHLFALVAFLSLYGVTQAQRDTIKVYFAFGSSKLPPKALPKLERIAVDYDLSQVDSIQFIGFADSVGRVNANIKLSRKRARNVYKACKRFIGKTVPINIMARGEGQRSDDSQNRRVEVIIHVAKESEQVPDSIPNVDPGCFFVDFEALEICNLRTITKRKKEVVHIEATPHPYLKKTSHYYVHRSKEGQHTVRKVKWRERVTGKLWWKKRRLVTTIPKFGFDRYQFFTLDKAPCDGCKENLLKKDTLIMNVRKYYPDFFLMRNMQARVRFFKRELKIRAPKEYVNPMDKYYYCSKPRSSTFNRQILWQEKKRKRKRLYYYTRVPIVDNRAPYIQKDRLTTICVNPSKGNWEWRDMGCGGLRYPRIEFQLNVEPGAYYHNDSLTGYLGAGISHTTYRGYASFIGGVNSRLGIYFNLGYQHHFFDFPFSAISPTNVWKPFEPGKEITAYGRLFVGADMSTSFHGSRQAFLDLRAYLGLTVVNTEHGHYLPRIFLKGGFAKDVLDRINTNPYPFVQVGATFSLNSLFMDFN